MPNAPLPKPTTPPTLTPVSARPVTQPTSVPQQQAPLGQPQKPLTQPTPPTQSAPPQVTQAPLPPARPTMQPLPMRPTVPLTTPTSAPLKAAAPVPQPTSVPQQQTPLGQPQKPPTPLPVAPPLANKPATVAMGSPVTKNVAPAVGTPRPQVIPQTTAQKPLTPQTVAPPLANKQPPAPQGVTLASPPKPAGVASQPNQPNQPNQQNQQAPATSGQFRVQQPPQTLTALSSMASNKLPTGALKTPIEVTPGANADDQLKKPAAQPVAPNAPSLGPQKPQAEFVEPKKSIFRFVPFAAGGVILFLLLAFVFLRFFGGSRNSVSTTPNQNGSNTNTNTTNGDPSAQTATTPGGSNSTTTTTKQVTLEYWGLWEASETMTEIIKGFESQNPGLTVKYVKQSHKDYRTRLQSAISSGNGPDLYRFHASWVPMLKQELAPLPSAVMSASEYQSTFYPIAVQQLQNNGQLVGIPLMYDGLVLYYNTDIFKTAVVDPPKTWPDLRTLANKLTVKAEGKLTRSGIALGNAVNVEHFADILAVLILQNGGDLTKPNSAEVRDALLFYTNFVKTDALWNDTLPSSTVAFARGEAAMMFAPSWRAHDVKAINPDLKFATVPLPQLSDKRIAWGSYWAEGVSAKSTHKDESWKLIKYLSSKEVQQKLFSEQAKTRSFGELFSRKDLADQLAKDPVVASVLQDAGFAQGWYMSSFTHDTGVNDQIIQYYKDAVNGLLAGKSIEEVLGTLDLGVSQVLRQYAIIQGTGQTTVK